MCSRFDGGDVDFEKDLGFHPNVNTFWVDGTWRVGRRHQLELAFTRTNRSSDNHTLTRDFTWGGEIYSAGLSASASSGSDILGGYYRFAAYRNDRFEIGPTIGIGYLWLNARIQATGTVGGPGGSQSQTLDQSASSDTMTGAIGGYTYGWLTKRLVTGRTSSTSRCRRAARRSRSPTGGSGRTTTSSATPAWACSTSTTSTRTVQQGLWHVHQPGRQPHLQGLPGVPVVPVLIRRHTGRLA